MLYKECMIVATWPHGMNSLPPYGDGVLHVQPSIRTRLALRRFQRLHRQAQ